MVETSLKVCTQTTHSGLQPLKLSLQVVAVIDFCLS